MSEVSVNSVAFNFTGKFISLPLPPPVSLFSNLFSFLSDELDSAIYMAASLDYITVLTAWPTGLITDYLAIWSTY